MPVSSRIQKSICIFNKISLFQWPETTHSAFEKTIFFFKIFFWNFQKNFFHQISPNYAQKRGFSKIRKKNFEKKNFFLSCFFSENRNKIAKNCSIKTMVTIPNRQDHEVFRKYLLFSIWGSFTIVNWQKTPKKFSKKNFFFQMYNLSTCVVWHKLKLYVTKWPHLRNTRIAFLWSKCLYYCHTSQSKYKS